MGIHFLHLPLLQWPLLFGIWAAQISPVGFHALEISVENQAVS